MEQNTYGQPNSGNLPSSPPSLQSFASSGHHPENNSAYFSWPTSSRLSESAESRANFFANLQKGVLSRNSDRMPRGQQASTLLDLMTIRAFHSKLLRCCSLGTAIGFRIQKGVITEVPAILVFVARKIHKKWLTSTQCLPSVLEGPGGVWCDVDVIEFSYYGTAPPATKEQLYDELADGLRGSDSSIGSGSQVANHDTYGTLGAIVKSRTGMKQVGFLTNRHVAIDLDYPNRKMFYPLPPNLGPGVYLGAVERATSFITDDLWYGIFAGSNPETFVRTDGAFIPFGDDFDASDVSTLVKGVGQIGVVKCIDLQSPIGSILGRQVVKIGRTTGLTTGTITAYSLEYNDEKGVCFFTDFLIVGENQKTFDLEGDSGSLIILASQQPQPIGIIWGGTANRGRLKLKSGQPPQNWTIGIDLGRLLDILELDLITTDDDLQAAVQEQRNAAITDINARDLPPMGNPTDTFESLGLNIQQIPVEGASISETNACFEGIDVGLNVEEHQFIPNSPVQRKQENPEESRSLSALRDGSDEDLCFSLHLGERMIKRQRSESGKEETSE